MMSSGVLKFLTLIMFCLLWSGPAGADIVGEPVSYTAGQTTLKGFIAYDDQIKDRRPGVLVVHEWWGHNDYARKRALMLAQLGYVALAVDMYGDGKQAEHPDEAGKFAGEVSKNMDIGRQRFTAAYRFLQEQMMTDPDRIAAVGYCFGGGVVLQMARDGVDIDGVVSFHGSLGTQQPAVTGRVKAKVLVLHGADDSFITQEEVAGFKKEMESAGVDYRFIAYPGAKHGFTNPQADVYAQKFNMPIGYYERADKESWAELEDFLKEIFEKD
jgi:dienelactone hydrolase